MSVEATAPRRASRRKPEKAPTLIAQWKAVEQTKGHWLFRWARGQVAVYRVGLVLVYIGIAHFGYIALSRGVPLWEVAATEQFAAAWSVAIIVGGLVAAVGSLRAGREPVTRAVRVFNWIELAGSAILFVTLGAYAGVLLYYGYALDDDGRVLVGSGFVVTGIHPAIRMLWLIFRPAPARKKINE